MRWVVLWVMRREICEILLAGRLVVLCSGGLLSRVVLCGVVAGCLEGFLLHELVHMLLKACGVGGMLLRHGVVALCGGGRSAVAL